jgi:RNA-directed DNA polymerase
MDGKQPKIRQTAFDWEPTTCEEGGNATAPAQAQGDEIPASPNQGIVPPKANPRPEIPELSATLMEEILDPKNLQRAYQRVKSNQGSPGVDGASVEALAEQVRRNWPAIKAQLENGTYQPAPIKRVEIPKPNGGTRKLGIPTVLDRLIQQAVMQVLQTHWDGFLSPSSFGFRPKRSGKQAVQEAQRHIAAGNDWVVDMDLEKFFDRVNHDILMGRLAKRIQDKRVLKLVRAFLTAGVMEDGLVNPTDEGTPQGGPLSPLLSNILLDDLDRELEARGLKFVRYADDCNIYVKSERAGKRVLESVTQFLAKRLRLKVNESKSAVARPWERKFLGFSFTKGPESRRRIAPQALDKFREKIRELTRRNAGTSVELTVARLTPYLRGWLGYFGFTECRRELTALDGWIRRRLRAKQWAQWKHGATRFAELTKRGVPRQAAAMAACGQSGAWCQSQNIGMKLGMPNAWFKAAGLPSLGG